MKKKRLGRRTGIDWSNHILDIVKKDDFASYHLHKPNTFMQSVKFIIIDSKLIVTGDYLNYIFCRPFEPEKGESVSDNYWCEKLEIHSCQNPYTYDSDSTKKAIKKLLKQRNLTNEQKEYLKELLEKCEESEFWYQAYAYGEMPKGFDYKDIPFKKMVNRYLQCVFDAFEEICQRM